LQIVSNNPSKEILNTMEGIEGGDQLAVTVILPHRDIGFEGQGHKCT